MPAASGLGFTWGSVPYSHTIMMATGVKHHSKNSNTTENLMFTPNTHSSQISEQIRHQLDSLTLHPSDTILGNSLIFWWDLVQQNFDVTLVTHQAYSWCYLNEIPHTDTKNNCPTDMINYNYEDPAFCLLQYWAWECSSGNLLHTRKQYTPILIVFSGFFIYCI